jgi:hypothetical protein
MRAPHLEGGWAQAKQALRENPPIPIPCPAPMLLDLRGKKALFTGIANN